MYQPFVWRRVTDDEVVFTGPCSFGGLVAVATAAGDSVTVYDGREAGSGQLYHTFTAPGAKSQFMPQVPPVHFDRGIYVVLSANLLEATIFYLPDYVDPPMTPGETRKMGYS